MSFSRGRPAQVVYLLAAVLGSVLMASQAASAYVWTGYKWPSTSVKYVLSAALTSSEKSYVQSCATVWNNGPSDWTLTSTTADGVYNTYSKTSFSAQGWQDIPGKTLTTRSGSTVTKVQTYINTDFSWNNDGVLSASDRKCDYKTVMLHEFGHWIILNEDSCHHSAVMWPNWTKKQALTTSDKDGLDYVY